jgi:MFS family permease
MTQTDQVLAEYNYSKRQIVLGLIAIFVTMILLRQVFALGTPRHLADSSVLSLVIFIMPGTIGAIFGLILSNFSDMFGRRSLLLVSLGVILLAAVLDAVSKNVAVSTIALCIRAMGSGAIIPLSYSALADFFLPAVRCKWIGLLSLLAVSNTFNDLSGTNVLWVALLIIGCIAAVAIGLPAGFKSTSRKIDIWGCILMAAAYTATMLAFSFAGDKYPWASTQIITLLLVSLILWSLFLWAETKIVEPILSPQVFQHRSFILVVVAAVFALFGQMALMMYFPMFLQGVQGISVMQSGQIITPYSLLILFCGVPIGFLLGKMKRFKWIYISAYVLLTVVIFGLVLFKPETPIAWSVVVSTLGGLGFGAIPVVNIIVVQLVVPRRLLGAATGALFFVIGMGAMIAPAVMGSAMNSSYDKTLKVSLPAGLEKIADRQTILSLASPRVLLSSQAMTALQEVLDKRGSEGKVLFNQTVQAVRVSIAKGLRSVFMIGAITMLAAFLSILAIPEATMDVIGHERKT